MPRIPVFSSTRLPPGTAGGVPMDPGAAAAPWQAIAGVGQQIERSALYAGRVQADFAEKKQTASDAIEFTELKTTLDKETSTIAEKYNNRIDYKNFSTDIDKDIKDLWDRVAPKDASPKLQQISNETFRVYSKHLKNTIAAKELDVMQNRGKAGVLAEKQITFDKMADESDPDKREILKNGLIIGMLDLSATHAVDPLWIQNQIDRIDKEAKSVSDLKATTAAKNFIIENPAMGSEALKLTDFWDNVPEEHKPALIKSADATKKAFDNDLKIKAKAAVAEEIKEINGKIGTLYIKKDYVGALALAETNSEKIGGDASRVWANTIASAQHNLETSTKDPTEEFDPKTYAAVSTRVVTDSDNITETEVFQFVGKGKNGGLTTGQAISLTTRLAVEQSRDKRAQSKKSPERKMAERVVMSNFGRDRRDGIFGEGQEGDLEYARQIEAFLYWSEKNPDKDPSDYYEKIIEPRKATWFENVLDYGLGPFFTPTLTQPKERREALTKDIPRTDFLVPAHTPTKTKRERAIDALKNSGKVITEDTIKKVMDQL